MLKRSLRAFAWISLAVVTSGIAHAAPMQWSSSAGGNDHWYEAVPWFVSHPVTGVSWEAANVAATTSVHMGMTGHLATITSAGENTFISGLVPRDQASTARPANYMIGGFQSPTATTPGSGWMWVTGEAFSYTNWNTGEPNNHSPTLSNPEGSLSDEDRLGFWSTSNADGLTWNDLTGLSEAGYVIEWEAMAVIPEPETYALLLAGLGFLGFAARRRATERRWNA